MYREYSMLESLSVANTCCSWGWLRQVWTGRDPHLVHPLVRYMRCVGALDRPLADGTKATAPLYINSRGRFPFFQRHFGFDSTLVEERGSGKRDHASAGNSAQLRCDRKALTHRKSKLRSGREHHREPRHYNTISHGANGRT